VARLWFRVFTGPAQQDELHEAHRSMLLPMVVLATITSVIGLFGPTLGEFLGHEIPWPEPLTAGISSIVALGGLLLGWFVYGRKTSVVNTTELKRRYANAYGVLANKYYLDLSYGYFAVGGYRALASGLAAFDARVVDGAVNGAAALWRRASQGGWSFDSSVIDGLVNGAAVIVKEAGASLRTLQSGRVRSYQTLVAGAVVLFVIWILMKGA
jgi:NADH:ubiquinone oxidoreductase subunit 5 (subunit L)/multisubunit Na+/H+ antiporter MnhA subunit